LYCGTLCQKAAYQNGHNTLCSEIKNLREEIASLGTSEPEAGTTFTASLIDDYLKNKKDSQLKDGGDSAHLHSFYKLATLCEQALHTGLPAPLNRKQAPRSLLP
jgi:hypothetical protein